MRRLLSYLWPYCSLIAGALVFLILNSVLQVAGPLLTKIAIDKYLAPNSSRISTPIDRFLAADPVTAAAANLVTATSRLPASAAQTATWVPVFAILNLRPRPYTLS